MTIEMIVRRVRVHARLPQRAIDLTGCNQNIDPKVVVAIPSGPVGRVEARLFQSTRILSNGELTNEYDRHGLESYTRAQIALNRADPDFADKHHNVTHFMDPVDGNWCYVAFVGHSVLVHRSGMYYNAGLWFLGIPK